MAKKKENKEKIEKRGIKHLSEKEIREIAKQVKYGSISYRKIVTKYNLSSLRVVSAIKKKYVDKPAPAKRKPGKRKPMTDSAKKKLQKSAIGMQHWKNAEIIIGTQINVLNGIVWAISNLKEISDDAGKEARNIVKFLEDIYTEVNKNLKTFGKDKEKEKNDLIRKLYIAIARAGDYVSHQKLKIDGIAELRKQLELYKRNDTEIEARKQVHEMLEAFFIGATKLDIKSYNKFKKAVIGKSELSRRYFDQYETAEEPEIQDAEYKDIKNN